MLKPTRPTLAAIKAKREKGRKNSLLQHILGLIVILPVRLVRVACAWLFCVAGAACSDASHCDASIRLPTSVAFFVLSLTSQTPLTLSPKRRMRRKMPGLRLRQSNAGQRLCRASTARACLPPTPLSCMRYAMIKPFYQSSAIYQ